MAVVFILFLFFSFFVISIATVDKWSNLKNILKLKQESYHSQYYLSLAKVFLFTIIHFLFKFAATINFVWHYMDNEIFFSKFNSREKR